MVFFPDLIYVFLDIATSNGLFLEKPLTRLKWKTATYIFTSVSFIPRTNAQPEILVLTLFCMFPISLFGTLNSFSLGTLHCLHQPHLAFEGRREKCYFLWSMSLALLTVSWVGALQALSLAITAVGKHWYPASKRQILLQESNTKSLWITTTTFTLSADPTDPLQFPLGELGQSHTSHHTPSWGRRANILLSYRSPLQIKSKTKDLKNRKSQEKWH